MTRKVPIRTLQSGIPGLDEVLGGGVPEFSFNLITGGPGCGKTTFGHHLAFANATPEHKAIYFTIIGEPPIKMLRYQQQFPFFDASKVGTAVRFVHLGTQAREGGLALVLERMLEEVEKVNPSVVVVDSCRSVMRRRDQSGSDALDTESFIQRLAIQLTTSEATTFLLGEHDGDGDGDPVFTVADGIISLRQTVSANSIVRKLQVVKMRGQGQIPGLQTMRIDDSGISVFPRMIMPVERPAHDATLGERLSSGTPALDAMLGGGIPHGYSVLVSGPSGSGKTILSNHFILEGAGRGEPGIIAVFEKRPTDYLRTTPHGVAFEKLIREKKLEVLYLRPLDLSIDETLLAISDAVKRVGAKRAVIDSLSGLELALAPTFREDFRESLYRMVGTLTNLGVTLMSTVELSDSFVDLRFSPQSIAFLSDAIIMQRYIEVRGQLRRAMCVVKVRGSDHSKDLREYEVDASGALVVGKTLDGLVGLLTGAPRP